jgi:predicted RNA binding protein YcfA (HicA-like mRNA interferase family)
MPHITPIHYRKFIKIFELKGFVLDRQEGDHLVYIKACIRRPVVVPTYRSVPVFIIMSNLKTAQISRDEYLEFLKQK